MANPWKFRADHVGSLLLPSGLADDASEDAAIKTAVAMQRDLGLNIVSDGQFRRHGDALNAQLLRREVDYLKGIANVPFKIALPAPGALPAGEGAEVRSHVEFLIAAGVRYVQLDNTAYASCLASGGAAAEFDRILSSDIEALKGIGRPEGVVLALYVGRGAAARSALFDAEHRTLAERLLASLPVDRLVLEVDGDPGGDFAPLRAVPAGTAVALGLITTRDPKIEARDAVLDRLDAAAEFIDGDNLALCPQTGFAHLSFSAEDQRRKLELVGSVATRFWGFEG